MSDGRAVTVTFTGEVTIGNIYADDGTAIEAQQATGPLQVSVTDADGKVLFAGTLDELNRGKNTAFSGLTNKSNCHGVTFADGEYWINDDQVGALMKGDGYDVSNPSETPTRGSVGVFSTDGNLEGTRHSVTVLDPGSGEEEDPAPKRGVSHTMFGTPTLVDSKGGIQVRQVVPVRDSWTNTGLGRENHQLRFYTKKVSQ